MIFVNEIKPNPPNYHPEIRGLVQGQPIKDNLLLGQQNQKMQQIHLQISYGTNERQSPPRTAESEDASNSSSDFLWLVSKQKSSWYKFNVFVNFIFVIGTNERQSPPRTAESEDASNSSSDFLWLEPMKDNLLLGQQNQKMHQIHLQISYETNERQSPPRRAEPEDATNSSYG
ncbi:hypothetical protein QE152_g29273 [Popillia japonica]|uniref:Uncharacterized protein n=1 Tax=Popillia japonica TaxID=7064 RepID=A0AAW1JIL8_POPJA